MHTEGARPTLGFIAYPNLAHKTSISAREASDASERWGNCEHCDHILVRRMMRCLEAYGRSFVTCWACYAGLAAG
jgi:hypothetical protein